MRRKRGVTPTAQSRLKRAFEFYGARSFKIERRFVLGGVRRATLDRDGALPHGRNHFSKAKRVKIESRPLTDSQSGETGGGEDGTISHVLLRDFAQAGVDVPADLRKF